MVRRAGGGRAATPEDLVRAVMAQGVQDPRLIQALRDVPRAEFVPPESRVRAYEDEPLPIPRGQVTTQPSLTARMIEGLGLTGEERVLEVGTGYGFQTALLCRLAAFVWTIERWTELAAAARANLEAFGVTNAVVVVGDGSLGLPEHAPYDAILVSAAFPTVPRALEQQLAPGGRLVQPIGPGGHEEVTLFVRGPRGLVVQRVLTGARFVRLYGAGGFLDRSGA